MREGAHVFVPNPGGAAGFAFGVVTGVDGDRIGVNGILVNPVGLKNKIEQGKAGTRSIEVLENPTPENCIHALIFRIEHDNFTKVVNVIEDRAVMIPPKVHSNLDGWIREELPELLNKILSLPPGAERDTEKRVLRQRMDTLLDKNLKRNLYSVCRSLKVLN